jgi:hypothetical protein
MELLKWYQIRNKIHDASGIEHPEQWWWGMSEVNSIYYPSKEITWEDCPRDDLNQIPLAIVRGWEIRFHYKDMRHGRITPYNVPHEGVGFVKGNVHTWKCYKHTEPYSYWRVADLIEGYFCNHRDYDTLPEVFEKEIIGA